MDEITSSIYRKIIGKWKKIPEQNINATKLIYGFDADKNLSKLKASLMGAFNKYKLQEIDMSWYEQWLPYADKDLKDWHAGWLDFEEKYAQIQSGLLPQDTDLDYGTYQYADDEIKQGLLLCCQPLKDEIIRMCQDQTLYDPI
jgi:hypothetical protein